MSRNVVNTKVPGLANAFAAQTHDETRFGMMMQFLRAHYDEWAKSYDSDLEATFYGPQRLVDCILKWLPADFDKNSRILDIGAGTGKVGSLLKEHGFHNIDGHDGSPEMLERAKEQGVYRNYHCEMLHETTPSTKLPSESYDLVVGVGVFNGGHMNYRHLVHLVRCAKPGAHVIIGISNAAFNITEWRANINIYDQQWKLMATEQVNDFLLNCPNRDPSATFYHFVKN